MAKILLEPRSEQRVKGEKRENEGKTGRTRTNETRRGETITQQTIQDSKPEHHGKPQPTTPQQQYRQQSTNTPPPISTVAFRCPDGNDPVPTPASSHKEDLKVCTLSSFSLLPPQNNNSMSRCIIRSRPPHVGSIVRPGVRCRCSEPDPRTAPQARDRRVNE